MQITLNGKPRDVDEGATVARLLESRDIAPGQVAVEINCGIVPRDAFGERRIMANDIVEILRFVGGG
jgi:thiamine biosynthesis protein ThiS